MGSRPDGDLRDAHKQWAKRPIEDEVAEQTPRYGDPRSAWAMVQGLTEVSQRQSHGIDRVNADRAAGKILDKFVF